MTPSPIASVTISTRLLAPSLPLIIATWNEAVFLLMNRASPISPSESTGGNERQDFALAGRQVVASARLRARTGCVGDEPSSPGSPPPSARPSSVAARSDARPGRELLGRAEKGQGSKSLRDVRASARARAALGRSRWSSSVASASRIRA